MSQMQAKQSLVRPDHLDTLTSMANLASTYHSQGRWDEAEKLFVDVINATEAKPGQHDCGPSSRKSI